MLRARLAVMEHRGLLQKYAVAELLPVLVISASLVLQVLLIIVGFMEVATGIVVVMVLMNLVMRFVVVAGVVIQAHQTIVHIMESVMGIVVQMVLINPVILVVEGAGVVLLQVLAVALLHLPVLLEE